MIVPPVSLCGSMFNQLLKLMSHRPVHYWTVTDSLPSAIRNTLINNVEYENVSVVLWLLFPPELLFMFVHLNTTKSDEVNVS